MKLFIFAVGFAFGLMCGVIAYDIQVKRAMAIVRAVPMPLDQVYCNGGILRRENNVLVCRALGELAPRN